MARGRSAASVHPRAVVTAVALTLVAGLLTPAAPAAAAPAGPASSAIVGGAASDLTSYRVTNYLAPVEGNGDGEVEDIEPIGEACQPLQGEVSQADIDAAVGTGPPPTGEGAWRYEVCAENERIAREIASAHPQAADTRRYCGPPYEDKDPCAVVIHWVLATPPPTPPSSPDGQQAYFESLFDFAPVLQTSPGFDAQHGIIANFPAWFWNTVETRWPKLVPGGHAWHLETTFTTDNHQACRQSGLHKVGTVYRSGEASPAAPSPSGCGYTYRSQGRYQVRGCTQWLFVIVAFLGPIVFAVTFCSSDTVTVKEVQVLSGNAPRRFPVPTN